MTAPANDPARTRARKIATIALHRAMAGDMEDAAQYMARLNHGGYMVDALLGFCDTYITRCVGDENRGKPFRSRWLAAETGTIETADEVSPPVRWAGNLIAARMADDEQTFMALLRAPAEGRELGDCVMALVNAVATSLNLLTAVPEGTQP